MSPSHRVERRDFVVIAAKDNLPLWSDSKIPRWLKVPECNAKKSEQENFRRHFGWDRVRSFDRWMRYNHESVSNETSRVDLRTYPASDEMRVKLSDTTPCYRHCCLQNERCVHDMELLEGHQIAPNKQDTSQADFTVSQRVL
jgi:hypothetical protein